MARLKFTALLGLAGIYVILGIRLGIGRFLKKAEMDGSGSKKIEKYQKTWMALWENGIPDHLIRETIRETEMEKRLDNLSVALQSNTSSHPKYFNSVFCTFPLPQQRNSVSLYNPAIYDRLVSNLIEAQKKGESFQVVASGGSVTAGGGSKPIQKNLRYYNIFGNYLNHLLLNNIGAEKLHPTVKWVGQGHGTRNSLHSALLFDNFIPSTVDLLLWEFSINDAAEPNEDLIIENSKASFLTWLHEVNQMKQPPVVILIYLWDTPFHYDNTNTSIVGRSFEAHGDIARQFDFVAGHVNMAQYVHELGLSLCRTHVNCPLLNDIHHTSHLGHVATAFLLLHLLSPTTRLDSVEPKTLFRSNPKYEWNCGVDTEAKRVLKRILTDSKTAWKSPLGGWTLELPIFDQLTPRRLVSGPGIKQIEFFGKVRPIRQDRQRCTTLSHCGHDAASSFSIVAPLSPLKNARLMLFSVKYNGPLIRSTEITVKLNGSNITVEGQLIPMRVEKHPEIVGEWPCHLSSANTWGTRADVYWFLFEKIQPIVRSVEICQPYGLKKTAKIQSLILW